MPSFLRKTRAEINLNALAHNYKVACEYAPETKAMAVIKANAYGHGLVEVAKALKNVTTFAVACVDEAIELKNNNISQDIVVLEGFNSQDELKAVIDYQLISVIHTIEQLKNLSELQPLLRPLHIWIKFDTGMHRLGIQANEKNEALEALNVLPKNVTVLGLMSHFANADIPQNKSNQAQLKRFNVLKDFFIDHYQKADNWLYCFANSAAILTHKNSHFDWVRPGIMLYGINPIIDEITEQTSYEQVNSEQDNLKPVMTLIAPVIAIKNLEKYADIGYGSTWTCPENMDIAIVAIGYGDGYPRHAVSGTPVLIQGIKTQLIGRVSMDTICIDLRPLTQKGISINIGDEVILWGESKRSELKSQFLAVEEVAKYCATIAYELLCNVSQRVKFFYN